MKRRKICKEFKYEGLGFPIILLGFELEEAFGEMLPKVNHRMLEDLVFRELLNSKIQFSGAHLAFIRKYMNLTQAHLAEALDMQGHSRISQWESRNQKPTGMSGVTELAIRILMADYLNAGMPELRQMREIMAGHFDDPDDTPLKIVRAA